MDIRIEPGVNVIGRAEALPFSANSFNEVHAINPHGFQPVSSETARVMTPGARLFVTGGPKSGFAKPVSAAAANAAGFRVISSGPMSGTHTFGTQKTTTGRPLVTTDAVTTVYERLP